MKFGYLVYSCKLFIAVWPAEKCDKFGQLISNYKVINQKSQLSINFKWLANGPEVVQ